MRKFLLIFFSILLISCGGKTDTEKAIEALENIDSKEILDEVVDETMGEWEEVMEKVVDETMGEWEDVVEKSLEEFEKNMDKVMRESDMEEAWEKVDKVMEELEENINFSY